MAHFSGLMPVISLDKFTHSQTRAPCAWLLPRSPDQPQSSRQPHELPFEPHEVFKRAHTAGRNGDKNLGFFVFLMLPLIFQFYPRDRRKNELMQHRLSFRSTHPIVNALRKRKEYLNPNALKQARNDNRPQHVAHSTLTLV